MFRGGFRVEKWREDEKKKEEKKREESSLLSSLRVPSLTLLASLYPVVIALDCVTRGAMVSQFSSSLSSLSLSLLLLLSSSLFSSFLLIR